MVITMKLLCKNCKESQLKQGSYWWCDILRIKVDSDDECHIEECICIEKHK